MAYQSNKTLKSVALLLVLSMLSACSSLPIQGPKLAEIEDLQTNDDPYGIILVRVQADAARILQQGQKQSMGSSFEKGTPTNSDLLGPGDVLNASIWEADPSGLFSAGLSTDPGKGSSRGQVWGLEVDRNGDITFPYAGVVHAAGLTTGNLSQLIRDALSKKTNNPEVHMERVKKAANVVTVIGGVNRPGVYPIGSDSEDILDILAVAGGSSFPTYETKISLTRGSQTGQTYLDRIIANPADNIFVQPQDEVSIERLPLKFMAFGAVTRSGQYDFGQPELTVLAGLAKARGLNDNLADPTGVFLFRFESRETLNAIGYSGTNAISEGLVPVIYQFDLRDVNQYFYAKSIGIHDDDMLYVANARAVGLSKFLRIIGQVVGIGARTAVIASELD